MQISKTMLAPKATRRKRAFVFLELVLASATGEQFASMTPRWPIWCKILFRFLHKNSRRKKFWIWQLVAFKWFERLNTFFCPFCHYKATSSTARNLFLRQSHFSLVDMHLLERPYYGFTKLKFRRVGKESLAPDGIRTHISSLVGMHSIGCATMYSRKMHT